MSEKFVSFAEMFRQAAAGELKPVPRDALEWWAGLAPDSKEYLDTIGDMTGMRVTFATQSAGNCGTTVVTNIKYGSVVGAYVHKASFKPVINIPKPFGDAWGGLIRHIVVVRDRFFSFDAVKITPEARDVLVRNFGKQLLPTYHSVIITDCVNRRSGYRGMQGGNDTASFMDLVEKSKIGYLVKSPVSLNLCHNRTDDLSIIRHWIYYPEGAVVMKADKYLGSGMKIPSSHTEFVAGANAFVDKSIKDGKYSREYIQAAFANWRKGTLFEGRKSYLTIQQSPDTLRYNI